MSRELNVVHGKIGDGSHGNNRHESHCGDCGHIKLAHSLLLWAFSLALALFAPLQLSGQVINAASCSSTDVQTAFNAVVNSTSIVNIPACSGGTGWATQVTLNVPSGNINLSIIGAGSLTTTGGGDQTVIVDNYASNNSLLVINTNSNSAAIFRLAGITIKGGTGLVKFGGQVSMNGDEQFRFDHSHLNTSTYSPGNNSAGMRLNGCNYGVADHVILDQTSGGVNNGIQENQGTCFGDTNGFGDKSWSSATGLGGANAFYIETSTINNGAGNDCLNGGRFVFRFNTFTMTSPAPSVQTHPTGSGGRFRGCRSWEIYKNTFTASPSNYIGSLFFLSSGTGVVWGNTIPSSSAGGGTGYRDVININSMRTNNATYPQTAPPNGWGYCGTGQTGSASNWDQNLNSTGRHCLDQPGMGIGDVLQGGFTSDGSGSNNVCDVTSGQCAIPNYNGSWSNEAIEPIYEWGDLYSPVPSNPSFILEVNSAFTNTFVANADYYLGTLDTGVPITFTGATGVGSGIRSLRPPNCTTGVAYWSTDQGSWNSSGGGGQGVLDKCTSTNTWTNASYTPYTYPHPLTGAVIPTTYTLSTSVTGSGSAVCTPSGSGIAAGTAYSCTITPGTGYSTSTVTGCGGTWSSSPYTGSMPASNCTVAATFTPNNYTITTATSGTGSGTITGCAGSHAYNSAYSCTIAPAAGSTLGTVTGCGGSGSTTYAGLMPAGSCTITAPFQGTAATPTFSPSPGTYAGTQSVTLATATSGATIYYTTNGSTPTTSSTVYSGPISVATTQTVKAIAVKTGWTNSAVASGLYTINGTLAAPVFTPAAGTYTSAQSVSIQSSSAVAAFSGTEGSNGIASNGSAPSRNAYTNCAESYSGGALQPAGFPLGQTACTSADRTAIIGAGGPTLTATTSTITGTGTHALQNGRGAGGTDSLTAVTATYGGASAGDCTGAPSTAALAPNITFPSTVSSAEVFSGTTDGTNFNTSLLAPTKFSTPGTDGAGLYVMRTCVTIPTTTGTGFHYESEPNHTLSTGDYFGFGGHYNFATSKWYYAPQGQPFLAMNLIESDGTVHTTLPFTAGHHMYFEDYFYRTAACTHTSGSDCMFYTAKCVKDFTAGGSLTCYSLVDASSGLTPSGTPVYQPTYPEEINTQTQADFNAASITRAINLDFKQIVAYTAPTICYTLDGSTPTGDSHGNCTHGTRYSIPINVASSVTIKAIATQSGYADSSVGTAAYVILPGLTLSFTATNGSISGTNCTNGTYVSGAVIGPCTATANTGYTFTPGWSGTGSASGISGTGTASFTITANSTATAAFTANSYTVSTATAGSGTGTVTGCAGAHNYATSVSCTVTATGGSTTATVSGCGGTWSSSPYTFTQGASNCTVTATFNAAVGSPAVSVTGNVIFSGTVGVQ